MANYHTHFCTAFPMTENQAKWSIGLNSLLKASFDEEEHLEQTYDPSIYDLDIVRPVVSEFDDRAISNLDITWQVDPTDLTASSGHLIVSDKDGETPVECPTIFLQAIMQKFELDDTWGLEWCNTCSSNCPGGFGGGIAIVSKDSVSYETTSEWLAKVNVENASSPQMDEGLSM